VWPGVHPASEGARKSAAPPNRNPDASVPRDAAISSPDASFVEDASTLSFEGGDPTCPTAPPQDGELCFLPNLECEYGSSNVASCDTVATCTSGGVWSVTAPDASGLDCDGGPPIACPSSYGDVPAGQPCSPSGGYCDYPEARCACLALGGGPAIPEASPFSTWVCQAPQLPCPLERPRLGSQCWEASPDLKCDYGYCRGVPGGNVETCIGGYWASTWSLCTQ
jgi:hypothetical protein